MRFFRNWRALSPFAPLSLSFFHGDGPCARRGLAPHPHGPQDDASGTIAGANVGGRLTVMDWDFFLLQRVDSFATTETPGPGFTGPDLATQKEARGREPRLDAQQPIYGKNEGNREKMQARCRLGTRPCA
ncbi:hypothetical protein psal_cds_1115 [Pandoravirus salinus]|uniref:Uncharacterized protein n=1 Tax=Pandoravirus salinus TaxID=1349410 RepID=S4W4T4_9VIRU|nr:hypothetical protein psal_cds_1115 [Pandoravirus salinus]AGO85350.1 hypothetical protein psal_cds_1115 [Pandoravirus salinus]